MANQLYHPEPHSHNTWNKAQIFVSMDTANGIVSGGVVPNVNDIVITWSGNIKFEERVTYVDPLTNFSTLEPVELPNNGNNSFVGIPVGVANLSNVANLFVNPTDAKRSATIDLRLPIFGVDLSFVRIFRGVDISNKGMIISVNLDSEGERINDKIPLVRASDSENGSLRYITRPFNLITLPREDELVTAVFYSDSGNEIMFHELVIKYNHVVANVHHQTLFINDVYLDTPYLNPMNKRELLIPKNLLGTSFSPRIFKEFQNGTKEELFIGSSNVTLAGWGDHVVGEEGDRFPIVLNYVLQPGETSQKVDMYSGKHMTTIYEAYVVIADIDQVSRMFVLPMYNVENRQYDLHFYIYNGNRSVSMDVTEHVTYAGYVGDRYGYEQDVNYRVDMTDIDGLPDGVLAGSIKLQLTGEPLANTTLYRLWYYPDDERYYGDNLRLKVLTHFGTKTLSVQNGFEMKPEWLENMFYRLEPLYDKEVENEAPTPDYMDIIFEDRSMVTVDVNNFWNGEIDITGAVPRHASMATVKFYNLRDNGSRLELAATSMVVEVV